MFQTLQLRPPLLPELIDPGHTGIKVSASEGCLHRSKPALELVDLPAVRNFAEPSVGSRDVCPGDVIKLILRDAKVVRASMSSSHFLYLLPDHQLGRNRRTGLSAAA
eukprot:756779-Hanusia_phi.AAC.4